MKRLQKALLAGLLLSVASICLFNTQYGRKIEESVGLTLLYKLRGPRQPPAKVVIINIDDNSSENWAFPPISVIGPVPSMPPWLTDSKSTEQKSSHLIFSLLNRKTIGKTCFSQRQFDAPEMSSLLKRCSIASFSAPCAAGQSTIVEMEKLVPPIKALARCSPGSCPFPSAENTGTGQYHLAVQGILRQYTHPAGDRLSSGNP